MDVAIWKVVSVDVAVWKTVSVDMAVWEVVSIEYGSMEGSINWMWYYGK